MTAPSAQPVAPQGANLRQLLEEMIERDASDLHITAGDRPKLRIDGDITDSNADDVLSPKDTLQLAYSILTENQKKRFEIEDELDFSFGIQNLARFRGNCFKQRGCVSHGDPADPVQHPHVRRAGTLAGGGEDGRAAARPGAGHGPDGLGQDHHARRDDRQDQPRAPRPHHHGRGPDRVHPPPPELHRQPARGGRRHEELRERAQVRAAPGPRRDPHRRNARPRDDRGRAHDRRDGPPRVRHAAHELRGRGDQPHHGRVPGAPAAADARAAGVRARGHRDADAAARARKGRGRVMAAEILVATPAIRALIRDAKIHQIYSSMQAGQEVRDADDERRAVPALHGARSRDRRSACACPAIRTNSSG